jgi:twinfilin-like protein
VFVYSCTNDSPIKLKMLYSTVKAVAIGTSEEQGLKIDKKLEISDPSEITEEALLELLHPPSEDKKQTFVRPSRPGRGNARLTTKK